MSSIDLNNNLLNELDRTTTSNGNSKEPAPASVVELLLSNLDKQQISLKKVANPSVPPNVSASNFNSMETASDFLVKQTSNKPPKAINFEPPESKEDVKRESENLLVDSTEPEVELTLEQKVELLWKNQEIRKRNIDTIFKKLKHHKADLDKHDLKISSLQLKRPAEQLEPESNKKPKLGVQPTWLKYNSVLAERDDAKLKLENLKKSYAGLLKEKEQLKVSYDKLKEATAELVLKNAELKKMRFPMLWPILILMIFSSIKT